MKKWFICLGLNCLILSSSAQERWSLQKCIDYARNINTEILNKEYDIEISEITLKSKRRQSLPILNSYINTASTFGQGQDVFGNTQRNDNLNSSFGLSAEFAINTFGKNNNEIKNAEINVAISQKDKEISILRTNESIILGYLNVVLKKEMVKLYSIHLEKLRIEHNNLKIGVKYGKYPNSVELESYADLLAREAEFEQSKTEVEIGRLELGKILQLGPKSHIDVEDIQLSDVDLSFITEESEISIMDKIRLHPSIDRYDFMIKSLEYQNKITRSQLYPTISVGGTLGTMFYNSFVFQSPLVGDQLRNNLYQQAFLRISIPIYNKGSVKHTLSQNVLFRKQLLNNLEAETSQKKNQLRSFIITWRSNYNKYKANLNICTAMKEALKNVELNFESGKVTYSELQNVRSRYLSSQLEKVKSIYNCYFYKCLINNLVIFSI